VEGPDFSELHNFFQEIYEDAYGALDQTAEYIRYLDEYAPGSMERFSELSIISGQTKIPRARLMIEELLANTQQMIELLNQCFAAAEQENQQGIADFVSQRLSQHGKYQWQLRSYLKDQRA
jgi:starvation-inducible DNA-binding protein